VFSLAGDGSRQPIHPQSIYHWEFLPDMEMEFPYLIFSPLLPTQPAGSGKWVLQNFFSQGSRMTRIDVKMNTIRFQQLLNLISLSKINSSDGLTQSSSQFFLRTQSIPKRNTQHFHNRKINWLMLFKKITVYSENHTKLMNTLCGQNVEFLVIKTGGTHSYHWALQG
jgi:hypothetical protein